MDYDCSNCFKVILKDNDYKEFSVLTIDDGWEVFVLCKRCYDKRTEIDFDAVNTEDDY